MKLYANSTMANILAIPKEKVVSSLRAGKDPCLLS
jgi:hypothetical protein